MKCNSCGGDLVATEQNCQYCGAANPGYVPYVKTEPQPTQTYTPPSSNNNQNYMVTTKKPFSWGIFILLLVFQRL